MKSKIILILVQVVLLGVAGGATWWFTKGSAPAPVDGEVVEEAPKAKQPIYFSIEPAFVVNLQDTRSTRFVQIKVDLMSREQEVLDRVEMYLPRVRNDLIMLFSRLDREAISTEESRLKLQQDTLDTVNTVLKDEAGKAGIEAVYFSKFVVQ